MDAARKKGRQGRADDAQQIEEQKRFEASGLTVVAFCRDQGIPVSTFYQRRARLKKQAVVRKSKPSLPAARFIDAGPVVVAAPMRPTQQSAAATELKRGVELRIDLGGGLVVHITRT